MGCWQWCKGREGGDYGPKVKQQRFQLDIRKENPYEDNQIWEELVVLRGCDVQP